MMRKALFPLAFAALMTLAVALPVQAAEPTSIDPSVCGGEHQVAARSETTLFYGWITRARRQAVKFLDRSEVVLTVDGSRVTNADLLWSRPIQLSPGGVWLVTWQYNLGRLGPANSIDTNFKLIFSQANWDGYQWFGPGTFADFDCRVFSKA